MVPTPTEEDYQTLQSQLHNTSGNVPLAQRFRALFTLKAVANHRAIDIISSAFDESALLGHELAYCLGQINDPYAIPTLERILIDEKHEFHPMVRHEAAEAIGAISHVPSLPLLKKHRDDPQEDVSVKETCEIAVQKIEHDAAEGRETNGRSKTNPFASIDPAPPLASTSAAADPTAERSEQSVQVLAKGLMDTQAPLFKRYRAMFTLRDIAGDSNASSDVQRDAVLALATGFKDGSALFRHEIAYIFGQLSSPHSIPSLVETLRDPAESDMVRHEAAEALGSMTDEAAPSANSADASVSVVEVLKEWAAREDSPRVVKESCIVALDMWEYENSDQFQYTVALGGPDSALEKQPAAIAAAS